ncbi:hypothetical protein PR048_028232 [Dryococelus australis]|uniref:Uncharacterized protein n=1 Tax=Dryococelus australis TaxID=614101 RepID=A0ABQ9GIN0_9NEOP|nr:hypothetical protein PR048_028232 [Dryococelus australis]
MRIRVKKREFPQYIKNTTLRKRRHFKVNHSEVTAQHMTSVLRSDEGEEQRRNERAWETGYPREDPPTNCIVRHNSHMRKSGVTQPGIRPGSPWWEASKLTAQPPWPLRGEDALYMVYCSNRPSPSSVVVESFLLHISQLFSLNGAYAGFLPPFVAPSQHVRISWSIAVISVKSQSVVDMAAKERGWTWERELQEGMSEREKKEEECKSMKRLEGMIEQEGKKGNSEGEEGTFKIATNVEECQIRRFRHDAIQDGRRGAAAPQPAACADYNMFVKEHMEQIMERYIRSPLASRKKGIPYATEQAKLLRRVENEIFLYSVIFKDESIAHAICKVSSHDCRRVKIEGPPLTFAPSAEKSERRIHFQQVGTSTSYLGEVSEYFSNSFQLGGLVESHDQHCHLVPRV